MYVSQRQPVLTAEIAPLFFFQGCFPLPVHSASALLPKIFQRHVRFLKLKWHTAPEIYPASKSPRVTATLAQLDSHSPLAASSSLASTCVTTKLSETQQQNWSHKLYGFIWSMKKKDQGIGVLRAGAGKKRWERKSCFLCKSLFFFVA